MKGILPKHSVPKNFRCRDCCYLGDDDVDVFYCKLNHFKFPNRCKITRLNRANQQSERGNDPGMTPLAVAALLADRMMQESQRVVAAETGTSVAYLLDMIELKREFSRHVLRYLGLRRDVRYFPLKREWDG